MENFVPDYILENRSKGKNSGKLDAATLFMDIAGFTAITEKLMEMGNAGVEQISHFINRVYEPIIEEIYRQNGFIAAFAGDAFTAIFPQDPRSALIAAAKIGDILKKSAKKNQYNFELDARTTLSYGSIEWGIVGKKQLACYFRGFPIDHAARMQLYCQPGQIIAGDKYTNKVKTGLTLKRIDDGINLIEKVSASGYKIPTVNYIQLTYPQITPDFIDSNLIESFQMKRQIRAEFRHAVSVFVHFDYSEKHNDLDSFATQVFDLVTSYGGYFNGFDFTDKGNTFSVLFGLPLAHEDDLKRAVRFSYDLKQNAAEGVKLSVGIAEGNVYAGLIGSPIRAAYTAIGDSVNLAARIMISATNEILMEDNRTALLKDQFMLQSVPEQVAFKGKEKPVALVRIAGENTGNAAPPPTAPATSKKKSAQKKKFIGDDKALQQVEERLTQLAGGKSGGIIGVYGPKGAGKSYFVNRALDTLPKNIRDNISQCYMKTDSVLKKSLNPVNFFLRNFFILDEFDRIQSFQTHFNQTLEDARKNAQKNKNRVTGENEINDTLAQLEQRMSFIAAQLGIYWADSAYDKMDAQARSDNITLALVDFFKTLSIEKPLVIILEDAHDLDEDSWLVFRAIASDVEKFPIAFIYTYRNQTAGSKKQLFDRNFSQNKESPQISNLSITLSDLNPAQTAAQIEDLLQAKPDDSLTEFVFSKSAGNPLYTEEIILYLKGARFLNEKSGHVSLVRKPDKLPQGIHSLMISRLDRLSPELRSAVQTASILGGSIHLEIFRLVLDSADFEQLLEEGVSEKIWRPAADGEYLFENDMMRQAAYEMQLQDDRKKIHLKIVDILEEVYGENPVYFADMAFHYKKAEHHKAFEYYQKAAEFTKANYKNAKALEFYDELLAFEPEPEKELKIIYEKAGVLETMGQWEEALNILHLALEKVQSEEHPVLMERLEVKSGEIYQKQGHHDKAHRLLEDAVEKLSTRVRNEEEERVLGDAYQWLGRTLWSMGAYNDSLLTYEKSLLHYKKSESRRGEALSLYYIGVTQRDKGNYKKAMEYYRSSLKIFEELNDKRYETYPLYDIALLYQYRGDMEKSKSVFERVLAIYEEIGYSSGLSAALLNLGVIDAKNGLLKKALSRYEKALDIARKLNERLAIAYTLNAIGVVYYLMDELDASLESFKEALKLMVEIRARGYYGYTLSYLSCLYAKMGKAPMALKAAMKHFQNIRSTGSDVEHGRSYLGVALALTRVHKDQLTPRGAYRLNKIAEMTEKSPTPEGMFQAAVETAHNADYIGTLLPSLRFWGIYNFKKGRQSKAGKAFQQALKLARKKGIVREEKRLLKFMESQKKTPSHTA